MNQHVGWTFMSTVPENQLPENGKKYACHSWRNLFLSDWWQDTHLPGGHKCPPYGGMP